MKTGNSRQEISEGLQACAGFVLLVLVLTGMSGTIYKLLSPDGWISHAFGRGLAAGMAAVLVVLGFMLVVWLSRGAEITRMRQRAANAVVYLFAFAGFVYLAQYWTRGVF